MIFTGRRWDENSASRGPAHALQPRVQDPPLLSHLGEREGTGEIARGDTGILATIEMVVVNNKLLC